MQRMPPPAPSASLRPLALASISLLVTACADVSAPGFDTVGVPAQTASSPASDTDAPQSPPPRVAPDEEAGVDAPVDGELPKVWMAPHGQTLPCGDVQHAFTFDRFESSFTSNNAFWMMWFAMRAFVSEEPATRDELASLGFEHFAHLDAAKGLQAMVAASDEMVLISFRGSTEVADYLNNAKFGLMDASEFGLTGRLHAGFCEALRDSWAELFALVGSLADRGQPIWLTGHSLGGTMATVTALKLQLSGYRVAGVYSFGGPRAGDSAFAQDALSHLDTRSYRIVNYLDLAPRVPPASIAAEQAAQILNFDPLEGWAAGTIEDLDYAHASALYLFDEGSSLTYQGTTGDWDDTLFWSERAEHVSSVVGLVKDDRTHKERHLPETYMCKLHALRTAVLAGTTEDPGIHR